MNIKTNYKKPKLDSFNCSEEEKKIAEKHTRTTCLDGIHEAWFQALTDQKRLMRSIFHAKFQ